MTQIGYTLSSEEHGPTELVDIAERAEEAGFDFLSISDHFHPWVSAQGESPFVWSTLGAIANATDEIEVGVGVTCPTIRIHPLNVAHAVATVDEMLGDRFTFGVGTGENLNEHVTGERWPEHDVRLEMLEESMNVMRKLWTGETISHRGEHFTVENARLYTCPDEQPTTIASAFGPQTAEWTAENADGLWCSGPKEGPVEAYEDAGGEGPKYTQLHGCYAETEEDAIETVYKYWPNGSIPGELGQELPTPAHFKQAAEMVEKEDIAEAGTTTSPDPQDHIDSLEQAIDVGYDHVYFHQIGPEQDAAIEFYEEDVLPSFA
ncbi:TIGR03557 family F420-dependent LLM class oxidoreductase [Natronorubrum daqingense]|uniref:F420-dependent oxidoreductase, G6PDH family n=1 Tax=Natronorubrum daqingense TaxID=588898 RepID=A0A1N6YLU7_9EURY|nr:TIGR03557 family F420-dependent LLM class oxidoreductase [Natronorubrum daqingense]APX95624.1 LLM class F420-dependent oxidoreductase [Natronorubrum daqingense]SIR15527.1 F420-dependent oxidoreductase, G6PDH family [Natronorubrum daqingense]